jgi:hypothetical protein
MGDANILTLPLQRIAKYPFMIYQVFQIKFSFLSSKSESLIDYQKYHE